MVGKGNLHAFGFKVAHYPNLSLRMHLRRFTRLTNTFSKKLDNLKAAVALYIAWYNFCRIHSTLRHASGIDRSCLGHH